MSHHSLCACVPWICFACRVRVPCRMGWSCSVVRVCRVVSRVAWGWLQRCTLSLFARVLSRWTVHPLRSSGPRRLPTGPWAVPVGREHCTLGPVHVQHVHAVAYPRATARLCGVSASITLSVALCKNPVGPRCAPVRCQAGYARHHHEHTILFMYTMAVWYVEGSVAFRKLR